MAESKQFRVFFECAILRNFKILKLQTASLVRKMITARTRLHSILKNGWNVIIITIANTKSLEEIHPVWKTVLIFLGQFFRSTLKKVKKSTIILTIFRGAKWNLFQRRTGAWKYWTYFCYFFVYKYCDGHTNCHSASAFFQSRFPIVPWV